MEARVDNRPLLGTVADADLFVPSPVLERLESAVRRRLNALVLGRPGAGKTTLLRMIAARHGDDHPTDARRVYVDLAPARTALEAVVYIADALGGDASGRTWEEFFRPINRADSIDAGPRLVRLVRTLGQAEPTLVLADSPPGGGASHLLFGQLREELWQLEHRWVVAAPETLRDELTRPPADAFFDVKLELGGLPPSHQVELLRRRIGDEPKLSELAEQTDGLPRSLVAIAREAVLSGKTVEELTSAEQRRQRELDALPPAKRAVVRYVEEHGPTSGSDDGLLATLRVSPQRARHLLRELAREGWVASFDDRQERQGRPRRLYALKERSA